MFDLKTTLLLITIVTNLGLAYFLYSRRKQSQIRLVFGLFTASTAGWALGLFLFRIASSDYLSLISVRLAFAMALVIAISLFYFSNIFPEKENTGFLYKVLITIFGIVGVNYLIFTDGLVKKIIYTSGQKGFISDPTGYILFSLVFVLFFVAGLARLWYKFFIFEDVERRQLFFITFSIMIAGILGIYLNLYLPSPWAQNFAWISTGPLFSTIIPAAITYSIYRHQLFDTKVVTTEIFTFILLIIVLVRTLLIGRSDATIGSLVFLVAMVLFSVLIIRSVNNEVQARRESERLANKLRDMNDEKSRMLSIASHQFRSPLTSIEGYASMIKDGSYGDVPEYLDEPINRIVKSSQKLAHIVDDFLNISRIEDGRMDYNFQHTDLEEIVNEVIEEAEGSIDEEKLTLNFETDESDAYPAEVDIGKFQQVITNLVDNAIKYTEEGNIIVRLKRDGPSLIVEVEDDGIGIDPDDIDGIFHQFSRADEARDVNVVGSGLGLYIAQQIIDAHHGQIWATSPGEGEGSTFHVRIPAANSDND